MATNSPDLTQEAVTAQDMFNLIYSGYAPEENTWFADQFQDWSTEIFDEQAWLEGTVAYDEDGNIISGWDDLAQWQADFGDLWMGDEAEGIYDIQALLQDPTQTAEEKLAVLGQIMQEQWAPEVGLDDDRWGNIEAFSAQELSTIMSDDAMRHRWLVETLNTAGGEGGDYAAYNLENVGTETTGISLGVWTQGDASWWEQAIDYAGGPGAEGDWSLGYQNEEHISMGALMQAMGEATNWVDLTGDELDEYVQSVYNSVLTDLYGGYTNIQHLTDDNADQLINKDGGFYTYIEAIQEGWKRTENYLDTSNIEEMLAVFQNTVFGVEGAGGMLGNIGVTLGQMGYTREQIENYFDRIDAIKGESLDYKQSEIDDLLNSISLELNAIDPSGEYQYNINMLQAQIAAETADASDPVYDDDGNLVTGEYAANKARYEAALDEIYQSGQAGGVLHTELANIEAQIEERLLEGTGAGDLYADWDYYQGLIGAEYEKAGYSWTQGFGEAGVATKYEQQEEFWTEESIAAADEAGEDVSGVVAGDLRTEGYDEASYLGQISSLEAQIENEKKRLVEGGDLYEELAQFDVLIEAERAKGLEGGEYRNEIARLEALIASEQLSAGEEGEAQQKINDLEAKIGVAASEGIEATGTYAEIERLESLKALKNAEMGTPATETEEATGKYADIERSEAQIANLQGQIGFYEEQRAGYGEDITRKEEAIAWQEQQRNILQQQSFANVRDLMSPYTAQAKAHRFSGGAGGGDPTAQYLSQVYGDMGTYGAGLRGIQGTISQQQEGIRGLEDLIGNITTTTIPGLMGEQDTQAGLKEGYYGDIQTILEDILPALDISIEEEEFLRSGYETDIGAWQTAIDNLLNITIPGLQQDVLDQQGLIESLGYGAGPDGIFGTGDDVAPTGDEEVTDLQLAQWLLDRGVAQDKIDEIMNETGGDVHTWRGNIADLQFKIDQLDETTSSYKLESQKIENEMLAISGAAGADGIWYDDPNTPEDESADNLAISDFEDESLRAYLTDETIKQSQIDALGSPGADLVWGTEDDIAPIGANQAAYEQFLIEKSLIEDILSYEEGVAGTGSDDMQAWASQILGYDATMGDIRDIILPAYGYTGDAWSAADQSTWGGDLADILQERLDIWDPETAQYDDAGNWIYGTGAWDTTATGGIQSYMDLIGDLEQSFADVWVPELTTGFQDVQNYLYSAVGEPASWFTEEGGWLEGLWGAQGNWY